MDARADKPHRGTSSASWLVCHQGPYRVALPSAQVLETMRPLRIDPMSAMPPFVRGLAVVRGAPVPVVDVGILLGNGGRAAGRWVTVSVGQRSVALAVESIAGVQELPGDVFDDVPPLLRGAGDGVVAAIGALDAQLLVVLEGARILTEEQWLAAEAQGPGT
jgi:purine-binding chemotaxis protein CheW